jgi:hypothetical protein
MGKVGSMHGRVHKCIKVLTSIKLMVRDRLRRYDVEWIIVTCGVDCCSVGELKRTSLFIKKWELP